VRFVLLPLFDRQANVSSPGVALLLIGLMMVQPLVNRLYYRRRAARTRERAPVNDSPANRAAHTSEQENERSRTTGVFALLTMGTTWR